MVLNERVSFIRDLDVLSDIGSNKVDTAATTVTKYEPDMNASVDS
jgi:hypothetical protein